MNIIYDKHTEKTDKWFFDNSNVFKSEIALLALTLSDAGEKILSVGCGSGLFEQNLKELYNIDVSKGIESNKEKVEIAKSRGLDAEFICIDDASIGKEIYDCIFFNRVSFYTPNIFKAFEKAYAALKKDGKIVILDLPKEGSIAILYTLAAKLHSMDREELKDIIPDSPHAIEEVEGINWTTTEEKVEMLKKIGFSDFSFAQTLVKHPHFINNEIEEPTEGYDSGNFVAIMADKK